MKKAILNLTGSTILAIGMMTATASMAAPTNMPINSKSHVSIYVDGNIGLGSVDVNSSYYSDPYTDALPSQFNSNYFAWAADLGLQFNRNIAVEAGYISFGQSSADTFVDSIPVTAKDTFGGFDILLKGILPINDKFNLFAKLGTADMNDNASVSDSSAAVSAKGTAWTPLIGVGASYGITQYVSLNLQDLYSIKTNYEQNDTTVYMPGLNALLAGVSFKFNA